MVFVPISCAIILMCFFVLICYLAMKIVSNQSDQITIENEKYIEEITLGDKDSKFKVRKYQINYCNDY